MRYLPRATVLNGEERPKVLALLSRRPALERLYFLTLILTGCRLSEALTLRREHLDLHSGLWTIPKPKNRRPHVLALPPPLVAAFQAMPLRSPYVFSESGEAPWGKSTVSRYWWAIRAQAGCPHVRIHDLRRTLATTLCQEGIPIQVVSWILNHQRIATTEGYVVRGSDPLCREVLAQHATRLLGSVAAQA